MVHRNEHRGLGDGSVKFRGKERNPPDSSARRPITVKTYRLSEKDGPVGSLQSYRRSTGWDLRPDTNWLTRIIILRAVGFVLAFAFLVALKQNKALLGEKGLLPANTYMVHLRHYSKVDSSLQLFFKFPTLLWFVDYESNIDIWLDVISVTGLVLSMFLTICGTANIPLMAFIWILYHSLVNVGQRWYSFGWESQLLETTFLAMLMCPLFSMSIKPSGQSPNRLYMWCFWWLLFRIMFGAGLIKIRGDQCWIDLTCMDYHYQTQPVPNPLSYFLHQTPSFVHRFETLCNHFVELVVPLGFFLTRRVRMYSATLQIIFQVALILSGNLSFLNWLTIIPALAFFDDRSLTFVFSSRTVLKVWQMQQQEEERKMRERIQEQDETKNKPNNKPNNNPNKYFTRRNARWCVDALMFSTIMCLSLPIVQNLGSPRQLMNSSFEPFRIVNTYGAFGSVTKVRHELILTGTKSANPESKKGWQEYEFFCKPGQPDAIPCIVSPYHYRLDWLMWFAAFGRAEQHPWLTHLVGKLLVNDPDLKTLIAYNPFEGKKPPKWIRVRKYRYEYTEIGSEEAKKGHWYKRTYATDYMHPYNLNTMQLALRQLGFLNSTAIIKKEE